MAVDRDRVYQALRNLDGERALRTLLERELSYDYEGGFISGEDLPEDAAGELDSNPKLFASTASEGRFKVIYARLATPGKLSLAAERKIMERLKRSYPYSLYVFSDAEDKLWHFVNAPLDPEAQGPGHLSGRKQYRRIVVGPGERFRTATERISLLSVDDLAEGIRREPDELAPLAVHAAHDRAFDVEEVTREFFREYRRVFESVEASVMGVEDEEERRYFVQRLFNRLMFVAFIEKKGWMNLGGRTDYLSALWETYVSEAGGQGFYRSRLKPLFFRGFNAQDGGGEDPVIGVAPYLNGGLFEEDEDDRDDSIDVPDGCLDEIINGLFAGFNFTTTESTPIDVEVAVDPEMLGKVFEELVTGRHETGSYYTPKPIVSFMCREALKGYLEDKLEASADDEKEAIRTFVEDHDPTELHDPESALGALRAVRVCDHACGSGAYLLGMLRELLDVRESLFVARNIDPRTTYQRKLEIIQNNIYGVDLDGFAVNIARLRLWLSLVVDYEGNNPPALPNLDFKIEVGDSLVGLNPSGSLETPDMIRSQQVEEYFRLKGDYLKAHGASKARLREQIGNLHDEIMAWAHPGEGAHGFDWQVEFAEVFVDGGFDIIVANPPYVRHELIRDLKPTLKKRFPEVYMGTADLYVYFYARALQLLRDGGMLAFISSHKWFRADYGKKLREYFADTCHVRSISDFGDLPVFESADAYPMIFVAQEGRGDTEKGATTFTQVESLAPPYPDVAALVREIGHDLPSAAITGDDWLLTDAATTARLTKMRTSGIPLSEYIKRDVYYGIKTGFNRAFYIDEKKRSELISQDPKSEEVIRPLAIGRNVKRWVIVRDQHQIFTPIGVEISRYPAVLAHLEQWQHQLETRYDKGNHWWELRACSYYDAFDIPKIVYPQIMDDPSFAWDETGALTNQKCFIITGVDMYLLGVLNSLPVWELILERSPDLRGGFAEPRKEFVLAIPVPGASAAERDAISELVQKCLDAKGVDCEEWEREIDGRVASLYGLSAEDLRRLTAKLDIDEESVA